MTPADVTAFREKLGLSMAKAARLGGIDRTTLWRWETGRQVPTPADYDHWQRAVASELRARLDSVSGTRSASDLLLEFSRRVAEHNAAPTMETMGQAFVSYCAAGLAIGPDDPRIPEIKKMLATLKPA